MDNRDRNRNNQSGGNERDRFDRNDQQAEQFYDSDNRQQGDDRWRGGSYDTSSRESGNQRQNYSRGGSGYASDTSSFDDYDRPMPSSRYSREETRHSYFRPDDFGGEDYSDGRYGSNRGSGYRSRNYGAGSYGMYSGSGSMGSRGYDRDERGFFDKAGDEVMSWFGDEDAERRRRMDHRGRGPANYERSNERLLEDACERLTHDSRVDATNINVTCADNEVTLDGTVTSRSAKRRAEDVVHDITGVKHVQNNLRIKNNDSNYYSSDEDRTVES
ncbi:SWFGD domain-containing protein [Qipengyuania sp.]|uniref:BON domain-containing protein n=1 Tax=Qipengyuania sp. TaxID=2004515 RepID=UPI0035C7CB9C